MNQEQIRILTKMKKMIREGKKKFITRNDGRDYIKDLADIGITEEEAWNTHIMYLNANYYFIDPKPSYYKTENTLIFKKKINGYNVYIKLKIEKIGIDDYTVCLSFHRDWR